jgi:hypothetical protein
MGPMAMFGGPQGQPKGDLDLLWKALGVRLSAGSGRPALGQTGAAPYVVYQDYNPHLKLELPAEFVFVDATLEGSGQAGAGFNQDERSTAGLQEVLFPFPGGLARDQGADVKFTPLVRTQAGRSGTIEVDQVMGNRGDMRQLRLFERSSADSMVLAALVERAAAEPAKPVDGESAPPSPSAR